MTTLLLLVAIVPLPGAGTSVENADGTFSTERTIGVNIDGKEYVIPTLLGGVQVSADEAIRAAVKRGLNNYPSFATIKEAEIYAQKRSDAIDCSKRWIIIEK